MTPRPPCVVVVDDDAAMGRAMMRMIELAGMRPKVYASAEEMLEQAPERIDCVVVDVHLPGMNGLELYARIAGDGDGPPAIFVSASEDVEKQVRSLPGAPRTFLAKPFSGRVFLETIKQLLGEAA